MYVSHPVRRIRDDPIEGETATLLLDVNEDERSLDDVAAAVADAGATVERERAFGTLEVTVAHERVDDVCSVGGIDAVETDATISVDPGDGADEDVVYDPG